MITAIIVTYNSEDHVEGCIKSILSSRGADVGEVIVVDNASSDKTREKVTGVAEELGGVRLISLGKNMGFPYACNVGAAAARGDMLAFVNPDVRVSSTCLSRLADVLGGDVAGVQPLLLRPGGALDSAVGVMDVLGHGYTEAAQGVREALYPCFACTLTPRRTFIELGGLDPSFFLYNEDLDYGLRAWSRGYRILFNPYAVAVHAGSHSTRRTPFYATYFSRRNRILTLARNTPLHHSIPASLLLAALYLAEALARGRRHTRLTLRLLASAARMAPRAAKTGGRRLPPKARRLVRARLTGPAMRLSELLGGRG